jgi:hypothetical protein
MLTASAWLRSWRPSGPTSPIRVIREVRLKGRRYRVACTIKEVATKDPIWIPETARQGWLAITRDRAIQDNPAEIEAVRDSGARMVAMSGRRGC